MIDSAASTMVDASFETGKILVLIIGIRLVKMVTLLYEIQSLRVILETLKYMKGPIAGVLLVQLNQMYLFATIGMFLWNGVISPSVVEI
jgi:two pore calcium channel protein 1